MVNLMSILSRAPAPVGALTYGQKPVQKQHVDALPSARETERAASLLRGESQALSRSAALFSQVAARD
jgi:hypothetical protein